MATSSLLKQRSEKSSIKEITLGFPVINAHVQALQLTNVGIGGGGTALMFLPTAIQYPLFSTPGVVDVSGMELAVALHGTAATTPAQTTGSAASTVELVFADAGTTATADGGDAPLHDGDKFSNTRAGGWTTHEAVMANATSTTDLDADDWVSLEVVANATALVGQIGVKAAFIYGKPGAIN